MAPVAAASGGDGSSSFARALASNSKKQRDGAMAALSRWLAARPSVDEADLLKVWKGMFYAMWHADKAPVQARGLRAFVAKPTASRRLRSRARPHAPRLTRQAEVAENMAAVLDACQPEARGRGRRIGLQPPPRASRVNAALAPRTGTHPRALKQVALTYLRACLTTLRCAAPCSVD